MTDERRTLPYNGLTAADLPPDPLTPQTREDARTVRQALNARSQSEWFVADAFKRMEASLDSIIAERDRYKKALGEQYAVLSSMLDGDWPIERLAPRLSRLRYLARTALQPEEPR